MKKWGLRCRNERVERERERKGDSGSEKVGREV